MFDVLIKGGQVVDGSGRAAFAADVAVKDGRVAAVAPGIAGEPWRAGAIDDGAALDQKIEHLRVP